MKKNRVVIIGLIIIIGIAIAILFFRQQTSSVSQDKLGKSIASIKYEQYGANSNSDTYEMCYIFERNNGTHYYIVTNNSYSSNESEKEELIRKGNINNKEELEQVINEFENRDGNGDTMYWYKDIVVQKDKFVDKIFDK